MSGLRSAVIVVGLVVFCGSSYAAVGGSVSGTVTDATGAVIPAAVVTLTDEARAGTLRVVADGAGVYTFVRVPVGRYGVLVTAAGFKDRVIGGVGVDTDAAVRVDCVLQVSGAAEVVSVSGETGARVETSSTALGEVVSAAEMQALPLNGRSYTDLLAIQPGVAPQTTLLASSVIMAGVTGSISPSGDENPGNLSIHGQRESANGFMVNGVDVQEHMNGGTSVVPDLDSIEQFRVLTNNFDAEYGNYNGGIVSVVTKSGTGVLHGSGFEFFRNTALDARGYFDPTRPEFQQNQFGGTLGGPVVKRKAYVFGDYQGTRTTQGISTGNISVPTLAERGGDFAGELTGAVSGPYLAQRLSAELGRPVSDGEAYSAVFPDGMIPAGAVSPVAKNLLGYIPLPNVGLGQFASSAYAEKNRDDKGSVRVDVGTRLGQVSGYGFVDDYRLDNPYPGAQGGASIPGFDALTIGRAQLYTLSATKVIGAGAVNEVSLGYLRWANVIGQPKGGLGVSLASQGFVTGAGTDGIFVQAPQFEGVENITFPTFVLGVPITNETQVNDTFSVGEGFSFVKGKHVVKVGVQGHLDQVNEHPNATFNGTFNIDGTETGSAYADFLLGTPSNYTQSSGQPFYLRNRYLGAYAQDSWRVRPEVTLNLGLRWDVIAPWSEKYNQLQTYVAGAQSVLYPGAPQGLLVAGDPGVPATIAPTGYRNFAPRVGVAYAPRSGGAGKTSVRASFGVFYTAFPGLSAGIMYAVPPFGYNYLSPAPPLLETPFVTAATGVSQGQRFPFGFPPHGVSRGMPDNSVDWADLTPISADPYFDRRNKAAYSESYMVSAERELARGARLTVSYVGNEGHRQLVLGSVNPGDPALCLALSGCGPFGEDGTYTSANGASVQGTRVGQSSAYGENTADRSVANSNYNALETTVRVARGGRTLLVSYTYAKSIDQGSNFGEQLNVSHPRQSRTISAFDLKHDFVASYSVGVPVERVFRRMNRATMDWRVSGTARFASGLPVTLFDNSDNSLLGTLGNGANNYLLDMPQFVAGDLKINRDGRNGRAGFNTGLFSEEALGVLGNSKRRMFYGPGTDNYDLTLQKEVRVGDGRVVQVRVEGFNVFNHAQFAGPAAVDGQIEDPQFGQIVSAGSPRLVQVAGRFSF